MSLTIQQALEEGKSLLAEHEKSEAQLDARLLLEHLLECDRVYILLNKDQVLQSERVERYRALIHLRATGIPLQQIIGVQSFMGLTFKVNQHVLIPRQETEELVELAMSLLKDSECKIIDIGTGSGCIPIALAVLIPQEKCIGVDISQEALVVARENSHTHEVDARVQWIHSDLLDQVSEDYQGQINMIISNPPYIKTEAIGTLMTEVKDHEPLMALDGGTDGLDFYRAISRAAILYLKDEGYLVFEVGHDQHEAVMAIMATNHYRNIDFKRDLSGIPRMVYAQK